MNNIIDPIDTRVVFYSVRTAVYVCCSPATTAQVFLPRISGGGASGGRKKKVYIPFFRVFFSSSSPILGFAARRCQCNKTLSAVQDEC